MGMCVFNRKFSIDLISVVLYKRGYFNRGYIVKDRNFCRLCRSASADLALDHSDNGSGSDFYSTDEKVGFENKLHGFDGLHPLSIVVTVVKSLNWRVARALRFEEAVNKYGFPGSIYSFRMLVHLFALAGMQLEVHALLRDVLSYYQKVDLDLLKLLPTMLDLCKDEVISVFLVDGLIKVLASNLLLENAVDVFFQAKRIRIQPVIRACNFLLKCLAERNKSDHLFSLFHDMLISGPSPTVYTYTILMNFIINGGYAEENMGIDKVSYLATIREEMAKRGISPSIVTHSVYIRGLCRVGCTELALNTIKELRQSNQPINVYCYNAVMHSFCKNGEPDKATSVFADMRRCGIFPDVYSYSILINGYCKFGNIVKGLALFEEMERDTNFKPSLVTYTSLLSGLCKRGLMEASVDLFHKLGNWGYQYDQHVCNILISGFLEQGKPENALELIPYMLKRNIFPNVVVYTSLIHGFARQGQAEMARLCRLMHKVKVGNAPLVFRSKVKKARMVYKSKVKKAQQLYKSMTKLEVTPNKITYTTLINLLFTMDKVKEAYRMFEQKILNRLDDDKISYTSVIAGLCKTGNLDLAVEVYRNMKLRKHLPTVVTYTCLIEAYCKKGRMDIATSLVDEMRRQNLSPDVVTYTVLVRGYLRHGQEEAAHHVFKEMRKEGLDPDEMMYKLLPPFFFSFEE